MEILFVEKAPKAIGPYCQAVRVDKLLFISGQVPFHPETGAVVGVTMAEQARQALSNLRAVLDKAGFTPSNIAKTTCYLADLSKFAEFNQVYAEFMGDHRPARACVEVAKLPAGILVEIEAVAAAE